MFLFTSLYPFFSPNFEQAKVNNIPIFHEPSVYTNGHGSGVGTTGAAGAGAPISFQLGGAAIEYSPPIIIAGTCAN